MYHYIALKQFIKLRLYICFALMTDISAISFCLYTICVEFEISCYFISSENILNEDKVTIPTT